MLPTLTTNFSNTLVIVDYCILLPYNTKLAIFQADFTCMLTELTLLQVLDALSSDMKKVTSDGTKYAYDDDEWITYDDEETVKIKVMFYVTHCFAIKIKSESLIDIYFKVKYALTKKLGGIMFWSIDLDDFRGRYHSKYPLLTAINEALKR